MTSVQPSDTGNQSARRYGCDWCGAPIARPGCCSPAHERLQREWEDRR